MATCAPIMGTTPNLSKSVGYLQPEDATRHNAETYERIWQYAHFQPPEGLPWWPEVARLSATAPRRLEIGPGPYPRLPVAGTHVVDLAESALAQLALRGALVHHGFLEHAGFEPSSFDLVGAFEVLEHVTNDEALLCELARIIRPGGNLIVSIPMGMRFYTAFDRFAGHVRRYEPRELRDKLGQAGFRILRFEMRPPNEGRILGAFYAWAFPRFPRISVWVTERFLLPFVRAMQLRWYSDAEWDAQLANAGNCTVICERL